MLEEFKDRIEHAKNKQFMMLDRFHIGDTVYPFWLNNFIVYGTVIDIDTVARKVICDFNGVSRQFCPQDLMLINPNLVQASKSKKIASSKKDEDNGINCKCKDCGGEIAVSYNEKEGKTDFVCTSCGKRIPQDKVSKKCKQAMRNAAIKTAGIQINNVSELTKLLNDTFQNVDNGAHCWGKLPSGNWFTTYDGKQNEKGILYCYINSNVDTLGYPSGKLLIDLGAVTTSSDCKNIAQYAFEMDKENEEVDDNITLAKEILNVAKMIDAMDNECNQSFQKHKKQNLAKYLGK